MVTHPLLFLLLFMCVMVLGKAAVYDKELSSDILLKTSPTICHMTGLDKNETRYSKQENSHKIRPMPCQVSRPFDSHLARAFLEQEVPPTEGCITNEIRSSEPDDKVEVHIIRYHSNITDQNVELVLKDFNEEGFIHPFIVVLSCNVRTKWQIRLGRHIEDPGKHRFVLSWNAKIRFANKRLEYRPSISKIKNMPFTSTELVDWTSTRYSAVTSYTSFSRGNSLTLTIGKASAKDSSSSSTSPTPSSSSSASTTKCNIQANSTAPLAVTGIERRQNEVSGCVVDGKQFTEPDLNYAYVVEMKNVASSNFSMVDIDLRLSWNKTEKMTFWLVLKSSSPVKWRVRSRHSEGKITFVSNDDIDDKGVHFFTSAVRRETLEVSGADLLNWVRVHLGHVGMYITVNNTNKLSLTLPKIAKPKSKPALPQQPSVDPDWNMEHTLKRALRTDCNIDSVTVAIDVNVLEMFGIRTSTMSLIDPHCRARRNNTHVYIESRGNTCGTKFIRTPQGHVQYINTLVLQGMGTVSEGRHGYDNYHDALEGEGSGQDDDVFSGSGDGGTDLILDDEDLHLKPLEIGFVCQVITIETTTSRQVEPMFQLELFHSIMYLNPYARFPIDLPNIYKRLYLQATVTSDPLLQANFQNCWLTDMSERTDKNKYNLLQNGCIIDNSISWHEDDALPQSERFSFSLENFVQQGTASQGVFLKCQMTVCCLDNVCMGHRFPRCVPHEPQCNRHAGRHHNPPSRLVILGPILLPQAPGEYEVNRPVSDPPRVESPSQQGSSSVDKQEHVVIEGLDSGTVIGISFAAFIIGVLMMGALWFIHTHSGSIFTSGPFKRSLGNRGSSETEADYGETTPGSSVPIST